MLRELEQSALTQLQAAAKAEQQRGSRAERLAEIAASGPAMLTLPDAAAVRVYGTAPRVLLGSAHIKAGELIPTRLLSPIEVQGLLSQQAAPQPL